MVVKTKSITTAKTKPKPKPKTKTKKKSNVQIILHKEKAREFLHTLSEDNNRFVKNPELAPEVLYSKGLRKGYKPHSRCFFYGVLLDAQRDSYKVYKAGREIVDRFSEMDLMEMANCYTYNDFWKVNETKTHLDRLLERVLDNGINKPSNIVHKAAVKLYTKYDCDPRKVVEGVRDYDVAAKRLREFHAIGPGKAALMVKNFVRFGYMELDDPYDMPLKIDRHMIKMSIGNGIVEFVNGVDGEEFHVGVLETVLADLYREITVEDRGKLDPILLCDIKWEKGSSLCSAKDLKVCNSECNLDCSMLVKMNKSGTYIVLGSDTRKGIKIYGNKKRPMYVWEGAS